MIRVPPSVTTQTTTLPPNLTRHHYEARRRFLQKAGVAITPWYQLTALERTAAEQEVTSSVRR
ncbi:hypothetical protein GCM10022207_63220 [Streptomyces lannensis]|uniref:Uncharacterized protein n=1 Tax=Streptomyces lannensis TaxID=766498 RepID=A0ABP7KWB8_9ACTN